MRAVQILLAAVMLGFAGGYGLSLIGRPAAHLHVPRAVTPRPFEVPETESDKEWADRALDKEVQEADGASADPVAIERSVYYANCSEARAAGKAPIYAGEPGYRANMDGDNDGIACEPYRGR